MMGDPSTATGGAPLALEIRGVSKRFPGVHALDRVDLDVRHNYHQPLPQLGPMAYAVLRVMLERLRRDGRLLDDHAPPLQTADGQLIQVELVERPPYASIRARA